MLLLIAAAVASVWYRLLPASKKPQARKKLWLYGGLGLLVLLLVTGRLHPLFAAVGALVPVVMRLLPLALAAKKFRSSRKPATGSTRPASGQTSDVETRFLRMSLDHDSGELNGVVLEGQLKGRRLDELKLESLLDLLAACRAEDPKSAAVLEAYLERIHGDVWHEDEYENDGGQTGDPQTMSLDEARQILEVKAGATHEDITQAHRRLIQKMHPDRGGSTFLAAKINLAKQTLLNS
jgi:hypothetical protein